MKCNSNLNQMNKLFLTAIFWVLLSLVSCNDGETEAIEINDIQLVENSTYGKILTDGSGKTLYFFSKDTKNNSVCIDGCLDSWPVFYDENLVVGEGLDIQDFSVITRSDGKKQTTYKGWPLYYYYGDAISGDTKGNGVNSIWYVAKPDYTLMYAKSQLVGHDGNHYKSDYTLGDEETFYITNFSGRTMYTFKNDLNGDNNFTLSDFSNNNVWPIVEISSIDKLPSILMSSDFGVIDVYGRKQLTYKGWPLYYFGQDVERGDNKGISYPSPGVWPIANVFTPTAP